MSNTNTGFERTVCSLVMSLVKHGEHIRSNDSSGYLKHNKEGLELHLDSVCVCNYGLI